MAKKLPPNKDQAVKNALARAERNADRFMATLREQVEIASASRAPDGTRPKFSDRWRPLPVNNGRHPAALAALEAHRWDTVFGGPRAPKVRKCGRLRLDGKPCKAPAIRGSRYCRKHGGYRAKEERLRRTFKDYRPDRATVALATIRQLARTGRIPYELMQTIPEFREAYSRARFGVSKRDERFSAWSYGERRQHHEACTMLVLAYLEAWEEIQQRGDWAAWGRCVAQAERLGLGARHIR